MSRGMEITIAVVLLVLLAPLAAGVALAIRILDGGPVVFVSERIRAPGQSFRLFKFRTMAGVQNRGVTGGDKAAVITALGRVLRRTRLDELPQIINILRGDLSFVGPRPPLPEIVNAEPELYAKVLSVRPGVTGLATLAFHAREEAILASGRTAAEVSHLYRQRCVRRKARIDLIYRTRKSALNDLWLMALTGLRVFGVGRGRRLWRGRKFPRKVLA